MFLTGLKNANTETSWEQLTLISSIKGKGFSNINTVILSPLCLISKYSSGNSLSGNDIISLQLAEKQKKNPKL